MNFVSNSLVLLIAFLHIYILILEMFLWTTPKGLKTFGQSLEQARSSAKLAANQGLYNGFLAAGLIWGLLEPADIHAKSIKLFFLSCVTIAGLYGAYTVSKKFYLYRHFLAYWLFSSSSSAETSRFFELNLKQSASENSTIRCFYRCLKICLVYRAETKVRISRRFSNLRLRKAHPWTKLPEASFRTPKTWDLTTTKDPLGI